MKDAWQKFNEWIDPKFGVHIFWIVPALLLDTVYEKLTSWQHSVKIKKSLKDNPDINELSKLSGIKNGKRKTD